MLQQDIESQFKTKLQTLTTQADQVRALVDKLKERVENNELTTESGISFLEVKHHTLLEYITDLAYFSSLKLRGHQIESHPVINRLIESRTVLEKMKPLEQRLRYQIDKLLRSALGSSSSVNDRISSHKPGMITTEDPEREIVDDSSSNLTAAAAMLSEDALADPSAFKPNPDKLAADIAEEDEIAADDGVYRAPKLVPVHYEEESNLKAKRERAEQRMMERAARSRLVQDLMTEYDDRPEMATVSGNASIGVNDARMERNASDRKRYEEDNLVRLTLGKKEKKALRERFTGLDDEFNHLNDFAGIAGLQKVDGESGSKAAILERLKQNKDNESMADKVRRRRRHGRDESDDEFNTNVMHKSKKGKFQKIKRRTQNRK